MQRERIQDLCSENPPLNLFIPTGIHGFMALDSGGDILFQAAFYSVGYHLTTRCEENAAW